MDKELAGIKVKFRTYYKYNFTFANDSGYRITAGGIGDEIYRCTIEAGKEYTILEVADMCGGYVTVWKDGEVIHLVTIG
ncbi:hypothetical protein LCGC14_0861450 [marine sediment metagenome]|uniref:Uncharacterized protein n=1 Tax=marine sediment metagenome TaxID=412755 RepID=A0A0F9RRV7_9ZZZZ